MQPFLYNLASSVQDTAFLKAAAGSAGRDEGRRANRSLKKYQGRSVLLNEIKIYGEGEEHNLSSKNTNPV